MNFIAKSQRREEATKIKAEKRAMQHLHGLGYRWRDGVGSRSKSRIASKRYAYLMRRFGVHLDR